MKAEYLSHFGDDLKHPLIEAFLGSLEDTGNWAEASRVINVSRHTTNGWRKKYPLFKEACDLALSVWRGDNGDKKCRSCKEIKPLSEFSARDTRQLPRAVCKSCWNIGVRARYAKHREESFFLWKASRAKARARSLEVPCDLDADHLESIWTGRCAVTGVEIKAFETELGGRYDENAAELDRITPSLGYTKGNVVFLSRRVNRIKNNSTPEEIEMLHKWYKNNES